MLVNLNMLTVILVPQTGEFGTRVLTSLTEAGSPFFSL